MVYQPPVPVSSLLGSISAWRPYYFCTEILTMILSDFNIPVNVNTSATSELLNLTSSFNLMHWTHTITHTDGNLLSLVFFCLCTPCNLFNISFSLSDHNFFSFSLYLSPTSYPFPNRKVNHMKLHSFPSQFCY